MKNTLNQYPPSHINNSRTIVRSHLVRMHNMPSEAKAGSLEDKFGIISDFLDRDLGNEGRDSKVYDVTDQFSQKEIEEMLTKGIY